MWLPTINIGRSVLFWVAPWACILFIRFVIAEFWGYSDRNEDYADTGILSSIVTGIPLDTLNVGLGTTSEPLSSWECQGPGSVSVTTSSIKLLRSFKQSLGPSSCQQILTHGVPLPHHSIAIKLPWREHLWGSPVVQWCTSGAMVARQRRNRWQWMVYQNPVGSKSRGCFIFYGQHVMPTSCLLEIPNPQSINLWSLKWNNYQ